MREKEKVNTTPKIKELKYKISNLESSLKNNNNLIDTLSDLLILLDTDGKILEINKTMAKSLGWEKEDLIGKNVLEYFPPEVAKFRTKMAHQVINSKKPIIFEDKRNDKWFKTNIFPVLDSEGNVVQITTLVKDITEEKKQLLESEEKFQMLSDQSLMGIAIVQDDKFKYVNNALAQMGGYKVEEFYQGGIPFFKKIVHPEDLPFVLDQLKKKLLGVKNIIPRYSFRILDKNKKERWIEIFSKTIGYEGRTADFVTFVDITEQMKATEALKNNEAKLQHLLISSPAAIYSAKPTGDYPATYVSENIKKITGYNSKDFVNDPKFWIEHIHSDDLPIIYKETAKLFNKEKNSYEYRFRCKDGKYIWIKDDMSLLFDKNGKPSEIIGYWADISEHIEFSHEIQRRKEYLQKVIDSASEIIFTIDQDFKIKTWNKTAEQITGYKKKHVVGKSINKLDLFNYPSEITEYIKSFQNNKTETLNEIAINDIYGLNRIFSVSPSYIKDESNNITDFLFVCRDITHEKEIYDMLKDGNSYLLMDPKKDTSLEIFKDLIELKHQGLFIGRKTNEQLQMIFIKNIPQIIKLTDLKDENYQTLTNPEELYQKINDFLINNKNTVIFIDRIDYLITYNSFDSVMKTLYKINDLIAKNNSILLLYVNPSFLNQTQISIFEEEIQRIPSQQITDIRLDEELFEILNFIDNESKSNLYVNYGKISKRFSISKITAKKRLEVLINKGLILSKKQGKTKILNITEKGKNLLSRRSAI